MIRLAAESDAEQMLAIYAPIVRQTAISFELEPPSLDEFWARVRGTLGRTPWLVCASVEEVLGYAYAGRYRPR
ncbi:MAG: N-acetyltransferase, partial [Chloroflexi bacterium]|nr:N-acetyltransferase [Chloroflexota bacterium]